MMSPRERTKLVLSHIEDVLELFDPDYVPFHWDPDKKPTTTKK